MTIYRVYNETLTYDRGIFNGYETVGYYANKAKAEEVKASIKPGMVTGKAYIEEIKVEE